MLRYPFNLLLLSLLFSCSTRTEKESLKIDVNEIDAYIAEKTDAAQRYDLKTGMRFSKGEGYAYSAVCYSQNDTAVLYAEAIEEPDGITYRNLFFKEGLPVFADEISTKTNQGITTSTQRSVYFNGAIVLKAMERSAPTEEELEAAPFREITMTMGQFDFERAQQSIDQQGDYEMKFGEFLIMEPASYLILENEESGYSVALYLAEGDDLINYLYENQETCQGKTVLVHHEFMQINGLQQMVYTGGVIKE